MELLKRTVNVIDIIIIFSVCLGVTISSITALDSNYGPVCYRCVKQRDPYSCNMTTRCAIHQKCFSSYSFYGEPFISFMWDFGCESESLCRSPKHDPTIPNRLASNLQRRDGYVSNAEEDDNYFGVCNECCDSDFCNELPCEHLQAQKETPKGLVCHSCHNIHDLSQCLNVRRCRLNEMCAAWTSTNGLLNMDCRNATQCSPEVGDAIFSLVKKDLDEATKYAYGEISSKRHIVHLHSFGYVRQGYSSFVNLAPSHLKCDTCCNTSYCAINLCQNIPKNPVTAELTPSNITTIEGYNESLTCAVSGTPPLNVSFFASSETTNSTSELEYCNKQLNSTNGNVTCVLELVFATNSSLVTCLVTSISDSTRDSANATIVVEELKVPLEVLKSPPDIVVIGDKKTTIVPCEVNGYPAPRYKWFRNDSGSLVDVQSMSYLKVFTASNDSYSSLEIESNYTSHSDESFLCQASNQYEAVILPFTVKSATNISILRHPDDVDLGMKFNGSFVSFQCTLNSYPVANIFWSLSTYSFFLNQSQLLDPRTGGKITADISDSDKTRISSRIDIPTNILRGQNVSLVNCLADNGYFSVNVSASVRNLTKPKILTPPATYTIKKGSDFTLRCESVGVPAPFSTWLFSDQFGNPSILPGVSISDSGQTFTVTNILQGGTLLCRAGNSQGSDQVAFKINVI